ncbi:MAG TPA: nitronate monooxygenase [Solirubrobacteraceae bacterium]|nr:nitronate monooxygenase [Solirubrobacteraceae bacterium]
MCRPLRSLPPDRPGSVGALPSSATLLERLGISLPVFQAGMGGGVAGAELAAAVSEAGGLGTIGILPAPLLQRALAQARKLTSRPIAVNLLLPFTRPEHWDVAAEADAVVTFWGAPVRRTSKPWIHQCGSVAEAHAARVAGADGVIAQGVQAGGHVRGTLPALRLLEQVLAALPGFPVLLAGGVADAGDVRTALEAGAAGVVSGTRFLLSEESAAHPEYKRRLDNANRTLLTGLFGFGWPAPHRVVPNGATERWLRADPRGPWPSEPSSTSAPRSRPGFRCPSGIAWPRRPASRSRSTARPPPWRAGPSTYSTPRRCMPAKAWRASATSAPPPSWFACSLGHNPTLGTPRSPRVDSGTYTGHHRTLGTGAAPSVHS